MVVKTIVEQAVEPIFLTDSYGYRPNKSALDAIGVTRERCWKYDWVLEFDIRGLFDNIDHTLLMRAVRKHVICDWALLYIERWLTAPMQFEDGTHVQRERGTPQGGVISPVLANLFLHYAFDVWMAREHPHLPWCRYADDGLIHCRSEAEALALKAALQARLAECRLEMHPEKSKIVYCRDYKRKTQVSLWKFDFLGYCFRPYPAYNPRTNTVFLGFGPRVSAAALKSMRRTIKDMHLRRRTQVELATIARELNPKLQGWLNYYGAYNASALKPLWRYTNATLVAWVMRKFKRFKGRKIQAQRLLAKLARTQPRLFVHWSQTSAGAFA